MEICPARAIAASFAPLLLAAKGAGLPRGRLRGSPATNEHRLPSNVAYRVCLSLPTTLIIQPLVIWKYHTRYAFIFMLVRTTNELPSGHVDDDTCTRVSEGRDDEGQEFCSERDFPNPAELPKP